MHSSSTSEKTIGCVCVCVCVCVCAVEEGGGEAGEGTAGGRSFREQREEDQTGEGKAQELELTGKMGVRKLNSSSSSSSSSAHRDPQHRLPRLLQNSEESSEISSASRGSGGAGQVRHTHTHTHTHTHYYSCNSDCDVISCQFCSPDQPRVL